MCPWRVVGWSVSDSLVLTAGSWPLGGHRDGPFSWKKSGALRHTGIDRYRSPGYRDNELHRDINGAPMTYIFSGKQFIAFAIGRGMVPSEMLAVAQQ